MLKGLCAVYKPTEPYKYTCYNCQAAVTTELANRLLHLLGKDYSMLHKIRLCGFIKAHNLFNTILTDFCWCFHVRDVQLVLLKHMPDLHCDTNSSQ